MSPRCHELSHEDWRRGAGGIGLRVDVRVDGWTARTSGGSSRGKARPFLLHPTRRTYMQKYMTTVPAWRSGWAMPCLALPCLPCLASSRRDACDSRSTRGLPRRFCHARRFCITSLSNLMATAPSIMMHCGLHSLMLMGSCMWLIVNALDGFGFWPFFVSLGRGKSPSVY